MKINHRKILDGIFQVCGVPEKIRPISSAVDKLDKMPWEDVRKEMIEEKGLAEEVADKIGGYVVQKGQEDLLAELIDDQELLANESMKAGLADMELLFNYLEAFEALENVSFDLSVARGLDYYTGVIWEVVTEGSAPLADTSAATAAPPKPQRSLQRLGQILMRIAPRSQAWVLVVWQLVDGMTILWGYSLGRDKFRVLESPSVLTEYSRSRKRGWPQRRTPSLFEITKSTVM